MTFNRSSLLKVAMVAATAASALIPLTAQADTSMNATQLSVKVAPISVTGTTLGASVNALGTGLTGAATAIPTISNTGALTAAGTVGADADTTFNLDLTARAADTAPVTTALSATVGLSSSMFGKQEGTFSSASDATLAITGTTAAVSAGTGIGSTASASFTSSAGTDVGSTTATKAASASNNQTTFTAERQAAAFELGGSGLTAVTAGGIGTAALGAAPTITAAAGGLAQDGVAFTRTNEVRTGQAGVAAQSADSTALSIPAYGQVSAAYGGTTAGTITPTSVNAMTVTGGGAGTTSTMSLVQSMSVFGP
jgi:hypothetical protein